MGLLTPGLPADVSVLELREGDWMVYDVVDGSRRCGRAAVSDR